MFNTREQKRTNQILHDLKEFNQAYPGKSIQIQDGMGFEPAIVTFGIRNNYRNHHVYLKIKSARESKHAGHNVAYDIWNPSIQKQLDRKKIDARQVSDFNAQEAAMDEDPAAFYCGAASVDSEHGTGKSGTVSSGPDDENSNDAFTSFQDQQTQVQFDSVDRDFLQCKVVELDRSITTTENVILVNQASMEHKLSGDIGNLKDIMTTGCAKGITLDYLTMAFRKSKAKGKRLQFSLDQEEKKRAVITQAYNKTMREKDQAFKDMEIKHQLEIQTLKQSAHFSMILKSIDQKLQGRTELQAAMRMYEDSDNAIASDEEEQVQSDLADCMGDGLPYIHTAKQLVIAAFGNRISNSSIDLKTV